jgi:large subunit ribosomal protein L9
VEVILTKDVEALGAKNEVVRVKDGYARNYLLPEKFAIPATKGNLRLRSKKIEVAQEARNERVSAAQEVAEVLNGKTFVILAKASKEGRLFGSVTGQDVVGCIFAFTGVELDKRMVSMAHPLKDLGNFQVNIKLTQGVTASVHIDVRPDEIESHEEEIAHEEATAEFVDKVAGEETPELLPEPGTEAAAESAEA